MDNYIIGIIDDEEDIEFIERTIIVNKPENVPEEHILFHSYPINVSGFSNDTVNTVINDMANAKFQLLIVCTALAGRTEIFRRITESVPKFPIIILTYVPEVYYKNEFVDADKVYSKRQFFKLEEDYSKEKTLNIFRNIDNCFSQ